jgi:hypothetical protein
VDEPEYEVGDMRSQLRISAPHLRRQALPHGALLSGRWRLGLTACSILLVVIVIVSAWLPLQSQPQFGNGVPSLTSQGAAAQVFVPTPLPITSTLASPPTNCPSESPLTTTTVPAFGGLAGSTVQLIGRAPVWIPKVYVPQRIAGIPESLPPSSAMSAWWPSIFILWEISPTSHPTAIIQVYDLHSGALAWWAEGGSTLQVPVLVLPPPPDKPTGYSSY